MKKLLYRSLLFILFLVPVMKSTAQESMVQDTCGNNAIVTATNQYEIGRFNECLASLNHCLERNGFDYISKVTAYKLSAMCYLALDSVTQANKCIERLLTIDDNFSHDVLDPQRFKLQVALIRTQMRQNLTSSVSKKLESIDMAPATIQIITAQDIQNRGYVDLESIFSDLPGFDVTRNFGISYSVLYQRGYRSPALTERTMILVDGIEDNELWTNAAFITKQYPLSNVKRVEVIYGPASTIYGANAFCGVINIVTKDEDDLFSTSAGKNHNEKPKNFALNMQGGGGSYNSRYVDGTLAMRNKGVVLTVTGRVYQSDGINQSADSNWDGNPNYGSAAYASRMSIAYSAANAAYFIGPYFRADTTTKVKRIVPTAAGISHADSLDMLGYRTARPNANLFIDPILDFYLSAKLTVSNFKLGFQYWNKNEGSAGDYIDKYATPNNTYTNWQVRDFNIYARYDKKLSEQMNLTSFTYYRYTDFGNDSRVATFSGYGNGGLSSSSALLDTMFLKGVSPRFTSTNYYQASNLVSSELKSTYVFSDMFDIVAGTEMRTGIMQADYIKSAIYPAIVNGKPDSSSPGGNNFMTYTISGYLTGSFHDVVHKVNVDLAGRVDNNGFRVNQGYGTVYNPRVDIVWYPGRFIFKGIYTTAFLDASNQNKFGTATSRRINNPTIAPERVKNFELTARYKFHKRNYVEVSAYSSKYTHTLQLVPYPINGFPKNVRYTDVGTSNVRGVQAASEVFLGQHVSLYGNLTFNDATSVRLDTAGNDSATVRTGDIAYVSANAGLNISFLHNKLNLNTRVNIVGDKPTGKNTSVYTNPGQTIPAYELLNVTLGYRVVKNILLQVTCNNLLDTKYYSPGVRTADAKIYAPVILQPGRNYLARVIVDLKK